MFGRPGESDADFTARCLTAANDLADKEIAALREQVRRQGHSTADADPGSRGSCRGAGHRTQGSSQRGGAVDGRLDPRWSARRAQVAAAACSARFSARPAALPDVARARRPPAIVLDAAENKLEALHRAARRPRGRARPRRSPTSMPSGWPTAKNVTTLEGQPGAHRRQGHPTRPGVDPGAVDSSLHAPCRRCC